MSIKSEQELALLFTTSDPETGEAADADSLPTGTLFVNGSSTAETVTVTNEETGLYKVEVTLPTLDAGDVVSIVVEAEVDGVQGKGKIFQDAVDTVRLSDIADGVVIVQYEESAEGITLGEVLTAIHENADAKVSSRLAASGYTAPDNAGITDAKTAAEAVNTRLTDARAEKLDRDLAHAGDAATYKADSVDIDAEEIADEVWSYETRSITTFGSLVDDIKDAVWTRTPRILTSYIDSAGIGTLLSRITQSRAEKLDRDLAHAADADTYKADSVDIDAEEIADEVWGHEIRTLSSFGTLVNDVRDAVWSAAARTLTAFGFTVNTSDSGNIAAIKNKTDNLPVDPASDTVVNTRLAATDYSAPPSIAHLATEANATANRNQILSAMPDKDLLEFLAKYSKNRLIASGTEANRVFTLYDDDDITVIAQWTYNVPNETRSRVTE